MDYKFEAILIIGAQICTSLALATCVCTRNFRPVCGSNRITYNNPCYLECAAYITKTDITIAKHGACPLNTTPIEEPSCICTFDYNPVCGTDGQTYFNECALNCQMKRFNPSLKVQRRGACATPKPKEPECVCDELYEPVCGSDGNSYSNVCLLNCAKKDNSGLGVAHAGLCDLAFAY